MSDLEAICPQTVQITLAGRQCEIKPLSLKAAIELGRILGQLHQEVFSQIKEGQTQGIAAKIFELASTNKIKEIIDILTHNQLKDIKNPDDKLTLQEASLLFKITSEINDFTAVTLNFKQALKGKGK